MGKPSLFIPAKEIATSADDVGAGLARKTRASGHEHEHTPPDAFLPGRGHGPGHGRTGHGPGRTRALSHNHRHPGREPAAVARTRPRAFCAQALQTIQARQPETRQAAKDGRRENGCANSASAPASGCASASATKAPGPGGASVNPADARGAQPKIFDSQREPVALGRGPCPGPGASAEPGSDTGRRAGPQFGGTGRDAATALVSRPGNPGDRV
jgi:hypothetical protein